MYPMDDLSAVGEELGAANGCIFRSGFFQDWNASWCSWPTLPWREVTVCTCTSVTLSICTLPLLCFPLT